MKIYRWIVVSVLFLLGAGTAIAQEEETNVLSYYAVGNSLDGQPVIERTNVLRFYPVYALRDYTDTVRVTIYYGPHIFTRDADRYDGGRYWQVLLPKFVLGEAIQRIEVETAINLREHPLLKQYQTLIDSLKNTFDQLRKRSENPSGIFATVVENAKGNVEESFGEIESAIKELDTSIITGTSVRSVVSGQTPEHRATLEALICNVQLLCRKLTNPDCCVDSILRADLPGVIRQLKQLAKSGVQPPFDDIEKAWKGRSDTAQYRQHEVVVAGMVKSLKDEFDNLKSTYQNDLGEGLKTFLADIARVGDSLVLRLVHVRDSLRTIIANESYDRLVDTMFTGPGVRKSDVQFDEDSLASARILYRNYKTSLRNLPALDPAERMGIFRLRYVPFVVRGKQFNTPFTSTSTAVFEVGLGFSNVVVSGDDFVMPELSLRRLGIAFAISSKLFSDEAPIRALVVTYDFNAYGSIGIGANFPGSNSNDPTLGVVPSLYQSYISFGINKLAFEQLLGALSGMLNRE